MHLITRLGGPAVLGGQRHHLSGEPFVPPPAPVLSASGALSGRVLTISVDSLTPPGTAVVLTVLRLDGADMRAEATGMGPWSYAVPSAAASSTVTWEVTAINAGGIDTVSGSETLAGDLAAPGGVLTVVRSDRTISAWVSSITGTPPPLPALDSFTAAGLDVTGAVTGSGLAGDPWTYAVPPSGTPTVIEVGASLDNGVGAPWMESGSETVPADQGAPAVSASGSLSGRVLTISVDALTGTPAPSVALTGLTRDGVDVLGDVSGSGPWSYAVPDSAAAQIIAWEVTASNVQGADTASGSDTVPANLFTPAFTLSVTRSGRVVTVTPQSVTGTPAPGLALTALTLDGVSVLGAEAGSGPWSYAAPSSALAQSVAATVLASNAVGTASQSGSVEVPADLFAPVAAGGIADQVYTVGQAIPALDMAADFTGTAPITYALAPMSAALPAGLSLSAAGLLTGTPTEEAAGRSIVVRGSNAHGVDDSAFEITVAAAVSSTPALFDAGNADGWSATYTAPPVFDPAGAPEVFTVTRSGYDAAGTPITFDEDLTVMSRIRQPYPNQAALTPDQVALSDFVYAGDVIAGAPNNSTRAAPRPISMWLNPDCDRVQGDSYTVRLFTAHHHARGGRPVAAVRFSASDGTSTVEQTVSAMTTITYAASGRTVPHFAHSFDRTAFTPGATITVDVTIYPWVGAAWQASVDGTAHPTINMSTLRFRFDDAPVYAYVDPGAGDDGTGAASTTPATAQAAPFATMLAAAQAIVAADGGTASNGIVRLEPGSYANRNLSSIAVGQFPVIVEGTDRATVLWNDGGSSVSNGSPDKLAVRNLTLQATGNRIFFDNGAGAGSGHMLTFANCDFEKVGSGSYWGAMIYRPGRVWFTDCAETSGADGLTQFFSSSNKVCNVIGCAGSFGQSTTYNLAGCRNVSASNVEVQPAGNREAPAGRVLAFSFIEAATASNPAVAINAALGPEGLALVGTIVEQSLGGQAAIAVNADGNADPTENVVLQMNTAVGQRVNFLYNDTGFALKSGGCRFSVVHEYNAKGDVFAANGAYTGNWPVLYKTGFRSNAYLAGSAQSDDFGVGSWLGEIPALGDISGSNAAPIDADWADDRSAAGAGGGGGDYTPGAATALPGIPAGLAPYSTDQNGTALANDGTDVIGAVAVPV